MELKEEIQLILNAVLSPLGIYSYFGERCGNPCNEYIIFDIVSSKFTDYANNNPTLQRFNYDVKYYATKESFNIERMEIIKQAMIKGGFKVFTPMMPLWVTNHKTTGVVIEFAKEQVVI